MTSSAKEHNHEWSLAWNKQVTQNSYEADNGFFWQSVYLCCCGAWMEVNYKYENRYDLS